MVFVPDPLRLVVLVPVLATDSGFRIAFFPKLFLKPAEASVACLYSAIFHLVPEPKEVVSNC